MPSDGLPEDLGQALRRAAAELEDAGVASPRADAELLAAHLMSVSEGREVGRGEIAARVIAGTSPAPSGFRDLVASRARRIPLQHLTGRAYFRNLTLDVGPGVFIPRPETEVLIDELNAFLADRGTEDAPWIVDLATGSGALALAAAHENPGCRVTGVELSEHARAWAERNAREYGRHGVTVEIVPGDATAALPGAEGQIAAIVTNPPYIPASARPRDPEVAEHDPDLALYGGSEDGLAIPGAFVRRAAALLEPGGFLVMEHAEVQASAAARLLSDHGFRAVRTVTDLTGRDRATAGYAGPSTSPDPADSGSDYRFERPVAS